MNILLSSSDSSLFQKIFQYSPHFHPINNGQRTAIELKQSIYIITLNCVFVIGQTKHRCLITITIIVVVIIIHIIIITAPSISILSHFVYNVIISYSRSRADKMLMFRVFIFISYVECEEYE